tara:strand:+ start:2622 stop:2774 length:153 start_codon:yes stop_codon:yes gene_type:complete
MKVWKCIEYYSKEDCKEGCGSPECGEEMDCICDNEFNVDCEYCNQLGMEN